MSAPYKAFAKIDASIWRNDKVDTLRRRSPKAFGLWITAICYSVDGLTDGKITERDVQRLGYRPQTAKILTELGFFEQQEDGSYLIHDFLDHQQSSDFVRGKHQKDAKRKRNVHKPPQNASETNLAFQAGVSMSPQIPGEPEPEPEPEPYIDRQTIRNVSTKTTNDVSLSHIPPIDPVIENRCTALAIDIDLEWESFEQHVQHSDEKPRDWMRAFNGWLKQAIAHKNPPETRSDSRTDAMWCRLRDQINRANCWELSPIQLNNLRKAYFQGVLSHEQATQAVYAEATAMNLTLPHEQQKI